MAKRRRLKTEVHIRRSVRARLENAPLEPTERFILGMHLKRLKNRLIELEGLLPEAVESPQEPGRFAVHYTTLRAEYTRQITHDARGREKGIAITIVSLACVRPGRPLLEM
jgi:hypothetical protein